MGFSKSTAIFALCVGILMFLMWTFFIVAGLVPEFDVRPVEIVLHLVAEFLTAIMLIASAIGILRKKRAGVSLMPFALGMLIYTLIVSPGYYAQQGDYAFVAMFGVLLVAAVVFMIRHLRGMAQSNNKHSETKDNIEVTR